MLKLMPWRLPERKRLHRVLPRPHHHLPLSPLSPALPFPCCLPSHTLQNASSVLHLETSHSLPTTGMRLRRSAAEKVEKAKEIRREIDEESAPTKKKNTGFAFKYGSAGASQAG